MTDLPDQQPPSLAFPLADGLHAELRPLTRDDGDLIRAGLSMLSEKSRRQRFGTSVDHLSDAEIRYLTDIDQVKHVAWGATIDGLPAGLGRYIYVPDDDCAEIAVTVVDAFQRRGLGTLLLRVLAASARLNGIDEFCFWIEPYNKDVLKMLEGVEMRLDETGGLITGRIPVVDVSPLAEEDELTELLATYQASHP